eukprot:CAMPEP_0183327652 /NCGR_PEP_ID=MMETSP0160_2-20130417/83875_1 /TAXON_ID=2839 ORGANISM="Odontella Sinensis, Strain Grunow 1884" /NCGR_SAMPLE_ID=MMETSP0160_2 /ASSEMBLY_ACC=CAM_ASM_000250 /LENGTH=251 /DNA_ID=CAMNT_0025495791 /DNA_START=546 /DNA_END=1301 /DNA_ORIENTATION=+
MKTSSFSFLLVLAAAPSEVLALKMSDSAAASAAAVASSAVPARKRISFDPKRRPPFGPSTIAGFEFGRVGSNGWENKDILRSEEAEFDEFVRLLPALSMSMSMPLVTSITGEDKDVGGEEDENEPPTSVTDDRAPQGGSSSEGEVGTSNSGGREGDRDGEGDTTSAAAAGSEDENNGTAIGPSVEQAQSAEGSVRGADSARSGPRDAVVASVVAVAVAVAAVAAAMLYGRRRSGLINSSGSFMSQQTVSDL